MDILFQDFWQRQGSYHIHLHYGYYVNNNYIIQPYENYSMYYELVHLVQ